MINQRPRLESVDLVRGVIMVIMALDHTRDFFGMPGASPTNMATTTAALFLTRWITHFCAPTFFLLTGVGSYLSLKKKTVGELSRFLFTRGLWLIVCEFVIVRCIAYQFNADFQVTTLLVLWALGWAMIVLSLLVRLPLAAIAAIGAVMIAGHNLLDGIRSANPLWLILHQVGPVVTGPHTVWALYPLIPWVGVTAVGFALGRIFTWETEKRRSFLLRFGLGAVAAFVLLRWLNIYGDPSPWKGQASSLFTVLSFLNTTKQPPSLLFLLMTLGPSTLFLWAADRGTPALLRFAVTIGRVPLFYFVGHFVLIHLLAVAVCLARYGSAHWMFESPDLANYPFTAPPEWGFSLPVVYGIWLCVVAAMYPLCRWFAALKQRRHDEWLSYL